MAIGTDFTTWMDAVWQPTQMPQLVSCKARDHLKTCPTVANCFLMATPLIPGRCLIHVTERMQYVFV